MRKIKISMLGLLLLAGQLYAGSQGFDIYGVDTKTQKKIYSTCSKLIGEYIKISKKMNSSSPSKQTLIKREKIKRKIVSKIKLIDDIDTVEISVVFYPTDNKSYTTLDLVKKNDTYRLPQSPKTSPKKIIKQSQGLNTLFAVWDEYDNKYLNLLQKNQVDIFRQTSCPVMHCIWGFDKKELEETLPKLQKGVVKYKQELIEIVKNSSDDQVRQKAIFILAHDDNYQEQARFLINFTDDPSNLVRNNVMRVLGAIVSKYKVDDLDINRIISALNYPYVTDRNKAAYVLLGMLKNEPSSHQMVINKAGETLLKLLKLQQPNNHDFAYQILKLISHKNYSDLDYKSWSQWVKSQQHNHAHGNYEAPISQDSKVRSLDPADKPRDIGFRS